MHRIIKLLNEACQLDEGTYSKTHDRNFQMGRREALKSTRDAQKAGHSVIPTPALINRKKQVEENNVLYDKFFDRSPEKAEDLEIEYNNRINSDGIDAAIKWFRSELDEKLGNEKFWDKKDELSPEGEEKGEKLANVQSIQDVKPNQLSDKNNISRKTSSQRVEDLLIALRDFFKASAVSDLDAEIDTSLSMDTTNNDNLEVASWLYYKIDEKAIDMDPAIVAKVFNITPEEKSKIAYARAVKRFKRMNLPRLQKIMNKIMDVSYSDDIKIENIVKLGEDLVVESKSGVIILLAGTKLIVR